MTETNAGRRRQAVSLAMAGVDWQTITDRCGYDRPSEAMEDVSEGVMAVPVDSLEPEVTRQLQIARLSRLLSGVWAKATRGDNRSVEVSTRLIEKLCKLQGVSDGQVDLKPNDEVAISAYDELAARRPGTPSGPRRQRGRRRQSNPTA